MPRRRTRSFPRATCPVGGEPTVNDEADGVRWVQPADLDRSDVHASMRQQIGDYLAGTYPYLG
jgi:hypothetical protein